MSSPARSPQTCITVSGGLHYSPTTLNISSSQWGPNGMLADLAPWVGGDSYLCNFSPVPRSGRPGHLLRGRTAGCSIQPWQLWAALGLRTVPPHRVVRSSCQGCAYFLVSLSCSYTGRLKFPECVVSCATLACASLPHSSFAPTMSVIHVARLLEADARIHTSLARRDQIATSNIHT
jgi:hypothetical protein